MDPIDMEQAMKDAWYIFENRVMKLHYPVMMKIAWESWFGPGPKERVIK